MNQENRISMILDCIDNFVNQVLKSYQTIYQTEHRNFKPPNKDKKQIYKFRMMLGLNIKF